MTIAAETMDTLAVPNRTALDIDGGAIGIELVDAGAWDRLLAGFDDASYEQCARFNLHRWGAKRLRCVVVRERGTVIGGACFPEFRLPAVGAGYAYMKFGPVWRQRGRPADIETFRRILSAIASRYLRPRRIAATIMLRPHPEWLPVEAAVLADMGFAVRPLDDPNRYVVRIEPAPVQLAGFAQKWRYNLRKAEKSGVEVREEPLDAQFRTFRELHATMIRRKAFADTDPVDALPELAAALDPALGPRLFVARSAGKPVAAAIVALCGDVAYYVFGASDATALPLHAGYLLQRCIIDRLRELGARWYDLGGEAGEAGLRQFKSGLVGQNGAVVDMRGEFEFTPGPLAEAAKRIILGGRDAARRFRQIKSRAWPGR